MDPESLEGCFVVEVGVRQAWPFLAFSDPRSDAAADARLYIDTEFGLEAGSDAFSDGDAERASNAALDLGSRTVTAVQRQDDCGLVLRFDSDERALFVSGLAAGFTTDDVWWLGTTTLAERGR